MGSIRRCLLEATDAKRQKLMGAEKDEGFIYECSRFLWRDKKDFMETTVDHKFDTKRMASLYVAKMNSNSVAKFAAESGKQWGDLCKDSGTYAIAPNRPFDATFLDLSDSELDQYAADVGTILHVHKAPQGSTYRYKPVSLSTMSADDLIELLND